MLKCAVNAHCPAALLGGLPRMPCKAGSAPSNLVLIARHTASRSESHWHATAGARYDPHTPPLVPRAGGLRGGGADASDGARLVSTSVFTPSLDYPPHEAPFTPGWAPAAGVSPDGTPSAPMLPGGAASSAANPDGAGFRDVPAALSARWHGDGGERDDAMGSPLPDWRRTTAYESTSHGGSAGGSPYAAAAAAQRPEHGSPQQRAFGGISGGGDPASHPLAFGSYVQPQEGEGGIGTPPPSRPSTYPRASPNSSPFHPRQVSLPAAGLGHLQAR